MRARRRVFQWSLAGVKQVLLKLLGYPFFSPLASGNRIFLELTLSFCCLFWLGGFYSTSEVHSRQQRNSGNPHSSIMFLKFWGPQSVRFLLSSFQGLPLLVCWVISRDSSCKREDLGGMKLLRLGGTESFSSAVIFIVGESGRSLHSLFHGTCWRKGFQIILLCWVFSERFQHCSF